jgi:hypothetical protein
VVDFDTVETLTQSQPLCGHFPLSPCFCEDCKDSNLFASIASPAGFHASKASKSQSSASVAATAACSACTWAKHIVSLGREPRMGLETSARGRWGWNGELHRGIYL